jgi:aryl sulfotransferase
MADPLTPCAPLRTDGWWPLRHKPNVLMLHFSEMKADHEGSVRKIAAHLGFEPTAEQWPRVLEYTSFKWMKENEEKFEIPTLLPFKLLESGGMVRKGQAGDAANDGMTPDISADIKKYAQMMVPDEAARKWLYEGGPL